MEALTRLKISSPAFTSGEKIPEKFTCDGENISPPLEIGDLPEGVKSLALIVDDPDAPAGTWTHWLMWDIPVTSELEEGSATGVQGKNGFGEDKYEGPCSPLGTHRYYFRLYALDILLRLPAGSTREELLQQMSYHILASGEIMGLYSR